MFLPMRSHPGYSCLPRQHSTRGRVTGAVHCIRISRVPVVTLHRVQCLPGRGSPVGTGTMSCSFRFFTGKLTMVGFFSTKKLFFVNRRIWSTMYFGSRVSRYLQA